MSATPRKQVAAHRSLVETLAFAKKDGGEAALLYLHVGPVQSFLLAARRTHDLFVGSFSIAYLTFLAAKEIAEAEGPDAIVYPALAELPLARATLFAQDLSLDEREVFPRSSLLRTSLPNKVLAFGPE